VPCDTDRPPKPALSASDDTGGPNWRLLDANPLVEKLRLRKEAIEAGNVSATTIRAMGPEGIALLGRLLLLWGDPPKRASRREREEATVAICAGLKALGHFLAQERLFAAGTEAALRKGITMPIPAHPRDESDQPIPVFEWDVVNRSDGGLKLRRTGSTPQAIAVGEVVGIKQVGKPRWGVGVARWITQLDDGGLEFGLQFLAGEARPVWVQPTIAAQPQAKAALLLPGGPGPGGMLLAPAGTYSELREFEVDDAGQVSCVRATALTEKSARFELFHVAPS
jgi:hypothetical protein